MNISSTQLKSMYFHVILNNHTSRASAESIVEHMEDLGIGAATPEQLDCLFEAIEDFRVTITDIEQNARDLEGQ